MFLLLFAIPALDLFVLVRLRLVLGNWPILLMVVSSGLVGIVLARTAGSRVLRDWRNALAQGAAPSGGVMDGALLLLGCVGLMVPGPISDVLGVSLLFSPIRHWVAARLGERLRDAIQRRTMHVVMPRAYPASANFRDMQNVIDVEGEAVESSRPSGAVRDKRLEP